jgi:hypothetical protein
MALLESSSRSVVSKASSKASTIKAESIAPRSEAGSIARSEARSEARSRAVSKAPTTIDRSAPSVVSRQPQGPPPSYTMQAPVSNPDDGTKAAKTIVGTLIGAAAGAAIAYAMVKGESQTEEASHPPASTSVPFASNFPQIKAAAQSFFSTDDTQSQSHYRAIEAPPPPRSAYTSASASTNPRSTLTRSVTSKNPRASTIYDGTEFGYIDNPRRASEGSIYSIPEDIPLRAIEYPPPSNASTQRQSQSRAPSTFISSYHEPRAASVHSSSTIKAPRRHSHDEGESETVVSHRSHRSGHSQSRRSSRHEKDRDGDSIASSSSRSPRNIPLPAGSTATYYSSPSIRGNGKDGASYVSARDVPLPESVLGVDVESVVPEDSISQVGTRSSHSHRSHRSHRREREVEGGEVGSLVSRGSQGTVKERGSRRGSQAV